MVILVAVLVRLVLGGQSLNYLFLQEEDGIRDLTVTGVQKGALPIYVDKLRSERISKPKNAFQSRDSRR